MSTQHSSEKKKKIFFFFFFPHQSVCSLALACVTWAGLLFPACCWEWRGGPGHLCEKTKAPGARQPLPGVNGASNHEITADGEFQINCEWTLHIHWPPKLGIQVQWKYKIKYNSPFSWDSGIKEFLSPYSTGSLKDHPQAPRRLSGVGEGRDGAEA